MMYKPYMYTGTRTREAFNELSEFHISNATYDSLKINEFVINARIAREYVAEHGELLIDTKGFYWDISIFRPAKTHKINYLWGVK